MATKVNIRPLVTGNPAVDTFAREVRNQFQSASGGVGPPGPPGANGAAGSAGAAGLPAYTLTTATFSQPSINKTVTVAVGSVAWLYVGYSIAIDGGGRYTVTAIPSSSSITIRNEGYSDSVVAGTSVASGKLVEPAGKIISRKAPWNSGHTHAWTLDGPGPNFANEGTGGTATLTWSNNINPIAPYQIGGPRCQSPSPMGPCIELYGYAGGYTWCYGTSSATSLPKTPPITVEGWVCPFELYNGYPGGLNYIAVVDSYYALFVTNNSAGRPSLAAGVVDAGGSFQGVSQPGAGLNIQQWYYAAMTWDGSYVRLWINGQAVGITACSSITSGPGTGSFGVTRTTSYNDNTMQKVRSVAFSNVIQPQAYFDDVVTRGFGWNL